MKITFLGAAKEVTGSNFLIETKNEKFIVDCGLFQGGKDLEKLNYEKFKFKPSEIDFAILTHAHIDHSGRLPKLVKDGFRGKIYATKPTTDLCEVMLADSANIQQNDVDWENKKRMRAGKNLLEPLYNFRDVENTLRLFVSNHYDYDIEITENIRIRFKDAGHILGSAIVEIWIKEAGSETKIVFSGDLGMPNRPIIRDPEFIDGADYLIVESTYGNTVHEELDTSLSKLIDIIEHTTQRGGSVIIPSFAVGRAQELIYELNKYYEDGNSMEDYRKIPVYIDSPMAVMATEVFMRNSYVFDEQAKERILSGDNVFEFPNLKYIKEVEESKMLNNVRFPRIIISSSGMATAGRVRHHLKHHLWDPKSSVVFVGYQAVGSLGRILQEGAKSVKLLGETVAVNAEIHSLEGFSGHADEPMLLDWINRFKQKPKKVFLVHGEEKQSQPLANTLRKNLNLNVEVAEMWKSYDLEPSTSQEKTESTQRIKIELDKELVDLFVNVNSLEENRNLIELDELDQEKHDLIKKALMDINSNLMDLNMLLGK
ncbi:MAG: MBL fold metallo-hydrolase [Tissierellia bacterium]|nr:MBL fold metallo-hydrolase [Tissierellia bacterium]